MLAPDTAKGSVAMQGATTSEARPVVAAPSEGSPSSASRRKREAYPLWGFRRARVEQARAELVDHSVVDGAMSTDAIGEGFPN